MSGHRIVWVPDRSEARVPPAAQWNGLSSAFWEGHRQRFCEEARAELEALVLEPRFRIDLAAAGIERVRTPVEATLRCTLSLWQEPTAIDFGDVCAAFVESVIEESPGPDELEWAFVQTDPVPAEESVRCDPVVERMARELGVRVHRLDTEHGPFASPHQAWAVCYEELQELFDEVRAKRAVRSNVRMRDEAIDLAAAALRFAAQLEREWSER